MKCPVCGTPDYKTSCGNHTCVLFKEPVKTDWIERRDYVVRKIKFYARYPKDIFTDAYYCLKNGLFIRHDLIRTGLSRTSWSDKDIVLEEGVLKLFCDYVEKEHPLQYHYDNPDKTVNGNDELLTLYLDIKVTLSNLIKEYEEASSRHAESCDLSFEKEANARGLRSIDFVYHVSKEYSDEWRDETTRREEAVYDFRTELLHRIIDMRGRLWT